MKIKASNNTYTRAIADRYIRADQAVYLLSTEAEVKYRYEGKSRTTDIVGYSLEFAQEGTGSFKVKFESCPTLVPFLSLVKFEELEGIEIRSHVYFKAKGIKGVK